MERTTTDAPRVVVTGYGTISSASTKLESADFLRELEQALPGAPGSAVDERRVPEFQAQKLIDEAVLRRMDRFTQLALIATRKALKSARLEPGPESRDRIGLIFNTTFAHFNSTRGYMRKLIRDGVKKVSAAVFPNTVYNAFAGLITMELKVFGSSSTTTGYNPIAYGMDLIRDGRDDVVIVGGCDELIPTVVAAFRSPEFVGAAGAGASAARCDPPFVLGEGAAVLILESEDFARRRGATPLAEVLDYGTAYTPGPVTQPFTRSPVVVERAMRQALELSRIRTCQVDIVALCANGLPDLQAAERDAVQALFEGCRKPRAVNVKPILGETFGASAAFSGVLAVGLVQGAALPVCTDVSRGIFPSAQLEPTRPPEHVLANSAEVGGTCTSIVFKQYREESSPAPGLDQARSSWTEQT